MRSSPLAKRSRLKIRLARSVFCALIISTQIYASYASELLSELEELERRQGGGGPPLIVANQCSETIYPGILTQSGTGPGTGGFELSPGSSRTLSVSKGWQGRVWGRTNCSFANGGGSSGPACSTGDCGGVSCQGTVRFSSKCSTVPVSCTDEKRRVKGL